jgi:hypothetical protein
MGEPRRVMPARQDTLVRLDSFTKHKEFLFETAGKSLP